ncbi:hypothetical protein [Aquibacillus saliphilus]|nr:hypothetical protein [Aquibacillus saliphilus]
MTEKDQYELELDKVRIQEETKRDLYSKIFWIVFWFMVITGCTITELSY